jgi:hypothetical protein
LLELSRTNPRKTRISKFSDNLRFVGFHFACESIGDKVDHVLRAITPAHGSMLGRPARFPPRAQGSSRGKRSSCIGHPLLPQCAVHPFGLTFGIGRVALALKQHEGRVRVSSIGKGALSPRTLEVPPRLSCIPAVSGPEDSRERNYRRRRISGRSCNRDWRDRHRSRLRSVTFECFQGRNCGGREGFWHGRLRTTVDLVGWPEAKSGGYVAFLLDSPGRSSVLL